MKIYLFICIVLSIFMIASCEEKSNPTSNQKIFPAGGCDTAGLYLGLNDTCSYTFVKNFFSDFDSVQIVDSNFYAQLFLYADSGDVYYWDNFFENDSIITHMNTVNINDSLFLNIRYFNFGSDFDENSYLINKSEHLHFINFTEEEKSVVIYVPEESGIDWIEVFQQFNFITDIQWFIVCVDYNI